jgi:beta-phosphoglucomutase-like phosphatase (HAD superfamily)
MKPSPYRVREAVGLLDAEHSECALVGDSTTDVLAGHLARVAVIGYADKPGKTQALADVQAAAVTTELAEITTALRDTPRTCEVPPDP